MDWILFALQQIFEIHFICSFKEDYDNIYIIFSLSQYSKINYTGVICKDVIISV